MEVIAYIVAVGFAFYANLQREELQKTKDSLPENIKKIYGVKK